MISCDEKLQKSIYKFLEYFKWSKVTLGKFLKLLSVIGFFLEISQVFKKNSFQYKYRISSNKRQVSNNATF